MAGEDLRGRRLSSRATWAGVVLVLLSVASFYSEKINLISAATTATMGAAIFLLGAEVEAIKSLVLEVLKNQRAPLGSALLICLTLAGCCSCPPAKPLLDSYESWLVQKNPSGPLSPIEDWIELQEKSGRPEEEVSASRRRRDVSLALIKKWRGAK